MPQRRPPSQATKKAQGRTLDAVLPTDSPMSKEAAAKQHAKRAKRAGEPDLVAEQRLQTSDATSPTPTPAEFDDATSGTEAETTAGPMPNFNAVEKALPRDAVAAKTMMKDKTSWTGQGGIRYEYDPGKPGVIKINGREFTEDYLERNYGTAIGDILAEFDRYGDMGGQTKAPSPASQVSYGTSESPLTDGTSESPLPPQPLVREPGEDSAELMLHTLFGVGTSKRPPSKGMGQATVDLFQNTPAGAALTGRMDEVPSRLVRGMGPVGGALADAMGMAEPEGAGRIAGVSTNPRTFLEDLFK